MSTKLRYKDAIQELELPSWKDTVTDLDEDNYIDEKLKVRLRMQMVDFLLRFMQLRFKYRIGLPYFEEMYLSNKAHFLKQYEQAFYKNSEASNTISFNFRTLYAEHLSFLPLVTELCFLNEAGVLVSEELIDMKDVQTKIPASDLQQMHIVQRPIVQIEALSGYVQKIIDDSGTFEPEYNIYFHFGIMTNAFYPVLIASDGERLDNRAAAYRNAPRFNSLLRELKEIVHSYGWQIALQSDTLFDRSFETEDGILIDKKIIYQEDIESGRVQIPAV